MLFEDVEAQIKWQNEVDEGSSSDSQEELLVEEQAMKVCILKMRSTFLWEFQLFESVQFKYGTSGEDLQYLSSEEAQAWKDSIFREFVPA